MHWKIAKGWRKKKRRLKDATISFTLTLMHQAWIHLIFWQRYIFSLELLKLIFVGRHRLSNELLGAFPRAIIDHQSLFSDSWIIIFYYEKGKPNRTYFGGWNGTKGRAGSQSQNLHGVTSHIGSQMDFDQIKVMLGPHQKPDCFIKMLLVIVADRSFRWAGVPFRRGGTQVENSSSTATFFTYGTWILHGPDTYTAGTKEKFLFIYL